MKYVWLQNSLVMDCEPSFTIGKGRSKPLS